MTALPSLSPSERSIQSFEADARVLFPRWYDCSQVLTSQIVGKFHIPQLDATHPAAKLLDDAIARDDLVDHERAQGLWIAILGVPRRQSQFTCRVGFGITHEGQGVRHC
jgi:hypothetical protein